MTFSAAIRYLESCINYERLSGWKYERSLKLARFEGFLHSVGDPHSGLRCFHVAGSKGKGSTCAFIAYILRAAGFSVGLYTSPHLSDFRERIRILSPAAKSSVSSDVFEGMIPGKSLARIITRLKPLIERFNDRSAHGALTFFEICTAVAFIYFKQQRCDFVVLETGLGGRLDATNVVHPLVAVITPISLEHTDKLGTTIAAIAGEKAGIIKPLPAGAAGALPVVSAPQEKAALGVIAARCKKFGFPLYLIPASAGRFPLKINLIGSHQRINAGTALTAVEALRHYGLAVPARTIRKGLAAARWPGRCEVLARKPLIIVDGAQNAASSALLVKTVKEYFCYKNLILVLGISSDKDIAGMCRYLAPLATIAIATAANTPRAADPAQITKALLCAQGKKPSAPMITTNSVIQAIAQARALVSPQDLILITGSLFVVGEAREVLWQKN